MAYKGKKIAAIVPAHNERKLIGRVIEKMPSFVDRIIVVDDGSSDDTARRVREFESERIFLLQHRVRQGVGAAIRNGYRFAIEEGVDIAIVMPGDAQADPGDLPSLLNPLTDGQSDYSKGNRITVPHLCRAMPPLRRFGNRLLSFLTRAAIGRREINDSQCGYTAINRCALDELLRLPFCNGYGYPNEILCNLAILRKRIAEVPVKAVYGDETSGIFIPTYAAKMSFVLLRCFAKRLAYRFARSVRKSIYQINL